MSLRDTFEVWDRLHRLAARTAYAMAVLCIASICAMLVSFFARHMEWGVLAAGTAIVTLLIGSSIVGGVSMYDHNHHHTPRPL